MRLIRCPPRRFISEGAWVIAGQLLSAIGALVGLRLLTTLLSPRVFGEVALVGGIVLLSTGMAANPLMQGVLRYYPDAAATGNVNTLRAVINRHLRRFTLIAAAILLLGFYLYRQYEPMDFWLGPIMVLLLIVEVLRQKELTLLNASRRQRLSAIWNTLEAFARPASAYGLALLLGATASITLAGSLLASAMLLLLFGPWAVAANQNQLNPKVNPESKPDSFHHVRIERALIEYSKPLIPLGLIGWISGQADRYLICGVLSVEEAGLYAAIYGIVSRPFLMAGGTLESWVRPAYYESFGGTGINSNKNNQIILWWLTGIFSIAIAGTVAFTLWHENIASVLLALQYRSASWLMPWIALGYGLLLIAQVYERVCYVHGETTSVLLIEMLGSMAALIATFYGLRHFGLPGAAYAVPVYFGTQLAAAVVLARKARQERSHLLCVESRANA
jgi:O-antigen/teichoic acid export membrane protein